MHLHSVMNSWSQRRRLDAWAKLCRRAQLTHYICYSLSEEGAKDYLCVLDSYHSHACYKWHWTQGTQKNTSGPVLNTTEPHAGRASSSYSSSSLVRVVEDESTGPLFWEKKPIHQVACWIRWLLMFSKPGKKTIVFLIFTLKSCR